MAKTWTEITEDAGFRAMDAADQEQVREAFWQRRVAPNLAEQDVEQARAYFDQRTRLAKQPLMGRDRDGTRAPVQPNENAGDGRGDEIPGRGVPKLGERMQKAMVSLADAPAVPPGPRRGGVRSEVRPFVAGDERVQAPPAGLALLDQPTRTDVPFAESSRVRRAQMDAAANDKAQSFRVGPATPAQSLEMDLQGMDANPVMRGAVAGFAGLGKTGIGAARLAADITGSEWLADRAKGAGAVAGATERGAVANLQGGDKLVADVTSSILNSAPAVAMGVLGGPAMSTLFAQSTLAEYSAGRDGGFGAGESLARAGIMGAAEVLGERFGFSEQIKLLKSVGKTMPQGELAKLFGSMLAKEIPGEQLTTAMQMLADKIGPAALRPNATVADYLEAAGETLKVTIGQTLVMGGGPAAISTARDTFGRVNRTQAAPEQQVASAIDQSAQAFTRFFTPDPTAIAPTAARADSLKRFDEAAAAWGLSPKAAAAVREQAGAMPSDDVPGFLARAAVALNRRGLYRRPVDEAAVADLDKRLRPTEPEKPDVAQPDVAAVAPEPVGAGDGGGDLAGGSELPVGSVPAEPGPVVSPAEAPAASGGQDQPVADGSGPDPALTIPPSKRTPEEAIARMAEQDAQDYQETKGRQIAVDNVPTFEDRESDDIVGEKGKPWASKTLANRKLRDLPNGYRLARVSSGWVIKPEVPASSNQVPVKQDNPLSGNEVSSLPPTENNAAASTDQAPAAAPEAAAPAEKAPPEDGRVPEAAAPQPVNAGAPEPSQSGSVSPSGDAVATKQPEAPAPSEALTARGFTDTGPAPGEWVLPVSGLGDVIAKVVSKPGEPIRAEISADYMGKRLDTRTAEGEAAIDEAIQRAKDGINAGRERMAANVVADERGLPAVKDSLTPAELPAAAPPVEPTKPPPKSFRKKHRVTTSVLVEETGKFEAREIDADTALTALDEDIKALQAFRACIEG